MLELYFGGTEYYDEDNNEFITIEPEMLHFNYSLKSIFDWEGKHRVSWLYNLETQKITDEQLHSMMECCCLEEWNPVYYTKELSIEFIKHIGDVPTATTIQNDKKSAGKRRIITSEQIYSILVLNQIPFEVENWNYNRLSMLIAVINESKTPSKKRNIRDIYEEQNRLNEIRTKKG